MLAFVIVILISVMDGNVNSNTVDYNLHIHMYGIGPKLIVNRILLPCNGTSIQINLFHSYHKRQEPSLLCLKRKELENSTTDVMCTSEFVACPLQNSIATLPLQSMNCVASHLVVSDIINKLYFNGTHMTDVKVLVDIIKSYKWTIVVLFYQNASQNIIERLTGNLWAHNIWVILTNIDSLNDEQLCSHIIRSFKETRNMTVICNDQCIDRLFKLVNQMDTVSSDIGANIQHRTKWIVLSQDCFNCSRILPSIASKITNVALIETRTIHVADCAYIPSSFIDELFKEVKTENIMCSSEEVEKFSKTAALLYVDKIYSTKRQKLWTLLFGRYNRTLSNIEIFQNDSADIIKKEMFPNTKFGFNRRTLLVSTLEWKPFNEKQKDGNYTGLTMDILDRLANRLNFTYKVKEPDDGQWGVQRNGTWTGMIGLLSQRKVDLVAAPLTVTFQRGQAVDFLYPIIFDTNKFVIKRPNQDEDKWKALIDIYTKTVLVLIGVSLIFSTTFLCIVEKVNPYYMTNRNKNRLSTLSDCFWYNYGALLTQGGTNTPDAQTGRTVLSYWWIFCIVSMAIYSGNLVAFLTIAKDKVPFNSMQEMVKQDKYNWGLYGGGAMDMFFSQSTLQVHKDVWSGITEFNDSDPSVLSNSEDVQYNKVMSEHYAYVSTTSVAEYYKARGMDLILVPEIISSLYNAFAVQKNSPYEEIFSSEILRLHESGLLTLWLQNCYPNNGSKVNTLKFKGKTIELVDVQSAFYLAGIGVVSGIIVWILEKVCRRLEKCQALKIKKSVTLHRMQSLDQL